MSTTLQHTDSEHTGAARMSVALIGPNDASRMIMAKALSASDTRTVREFADYPAKLDDVSHFADEFDFVIIDFDSDESYALKIVEELAATGSTTVMVYSVRNDPSLVMTAMRAGARDFLPLPDDVVATPSVPPAATVTAPRAPAQQGPALVPKEAPPARPVVMRPIEPQEAPEKRATSVRTSLIEDDGQRPLTPREPVQTDAIAPDFNKPSSAQARALMAAVLKDPEPSSPFPSEQPAAAEPAKRPPSSEPMPLFRASGGIETDADVLALFRSAQIAEDQEPKSDWKKWVYIAAGPAVLVIVLLIVFLHPFRQSSSAVPAQAAVSQPRAADTVTPDVNPSQAPVSVPKSWQPITSTSVQPSPATSVSSPTKQVSPEMMNAQLTAPARISGDMKKLNSAEEAPGALALGAIDNSGGLPGTVLGSGNKLSVVPVVSKISAGVAEGMLIRKTEPVYPKFARDNHIGGTVVLKANITKTGSLAGLHVVSGPKILAAAALDAAKNWRYRPYTLDNQPVEVETNISIVFSLGKQ
jgi:protein TonB